MKLTIPYYAQKKDYTCGPATLEMVFSFLGHVKSQGKLAKSLKVRKSKGTANWQMVNGARKEGFFVYVNDDATIAEIKFFLHQGLPVIANYIEPSENEAHFAVVIGYGAITGNLILNDPWNGANFRIREKDFVSRWYSDEKKHKRWFMVVSRKPFLLGRQYAPLGIHKKKKHATPQSSATA